MRRRTFRLPGAGERSLTLLHVFLLASAAILVGGAVVLGSLLAGAVRAQAVEDARTSLTEYVDGVLRPDLVRSGRLAVAPGLTARILSELSARGDIVTVKVWRADGVLAWTNRDPSRIGRRFELEDRLGDAIRRNQAVAGIDTLNAEENATEKKLGFTRLLQVYTPIDVKGRAIGAYEIYADPSRIQSFIADRRRTMWLVVAGVFAVLYAALALLVRGASSALRRRSRELAESYRLLEESSFEAIESLNATVEAKDPYTAGHSQRVQAIAVMVGEELDLGDESLDALRFGGLFHDIGKIAVPDAILTKPAPLSPQEYEQIRRHSAEGARIVGKLGRLRAAVPVIRHHHERWDGLGYPDGLTREEIPLEAAIVGLADAWDAMTTERPYARALSHDEALEQLREGRGKQFAPAVVDAFVATLRSEPWQTSESSTFIAAESRPSSTTRSASSGNGTRSRRTSETSPV